MQVPIFLGPVSRQERKLIESHQCNNDRMKSKHPTDDSRTVKHYHGDEETKEEAIANSRSYGIFVAHNLAQMK